MTEINTVDDFRIFLGQARAQNNLTQSEAGLLLGARRETIARHESGKNLAPLDVAIRLLGIYGYKIKIVPIEE
jgi:DNA-binding XRE family transcriptional regulator